MPKPVSHGARLQCTCGIREAKLRVKHRGAKSGAQGSVAVLGDCAPLVNIPPFGGCLASANPYTPPPGGNKPCVPRFSGQWSEEVSESIQLQGNKLVEQRATLTCDYSGTVSILDPGQTETTLQDSLMKNPITSGGSAAAGGSGAAGGGSSQGIGGEG